MWDDIALVVGAYLLGSVPHLVGLARLTGLDSSGDLHIKLWNERGPTVGLVAIFGELIKGAVPVLVGKGLDFDILTVTLAGLAVVTGQMWSMFRRFKGEKGNSIGVAMSASLSIIPLLFAAIAFAVGAAVKLMPRLLNRNISVKEKVEFGGPQSLSLPLGMAVGFLVLPLASWGFGDPVVVTLGFSVMFILIMIKRMTADVRQDLVEGVSLRSVLINRFLFDRSFI